MAEVFASSFGCWCLVCHALITDWLMSFTDSPPYCWMVYLSSGLSSWSCFLHHVQRECWSLGLGIFLFIATAAMLADYRQSVTVPLLIASACSSCSQFSLLVAMSCTAEAQDFFCYGDEAISLLRIRIGYRWVLGKFVGSSSSSLFSPLAYFDHRVQSEFR